MIYRASIFVILFSVLFISVSAQHFSAGNRFQLDKIKGCAPLDINITVNLPSLCDASNPCVIDFGDGNSGAFTSGHTYTDPGIYTLGIIFGASGQDVITIEVIPDIQPEFEIYGCSGTSTVVMKVTDTNYDEYTVTYSDGFSTLLNTPPFTHTHAFATPGPKTVSVQGRKSGYENNCTPMVKALTVSPTLLDGQITQLTVLNTTEIQLDFNNPQFTLYKLEIATNSTTFQPFQNIYNSTSFTVSNLRTDDNYYCFRLGTFDACSGTIISYSDVICSTNFDATAQNGFNKLDWKTSPTGITNYSISKTDNTTIFTPLTTTPPALTINDADVTCNIKYFYQLTSTYANGSTSTSLVKDATAFSSSPPTPIENITTVVHENSVDIEWQQDPAFTAFEYSVYKVSGSLTTLIAKTASTSTTDPQYNTSSGICYQIAYSDVCGNQSLPSIKACPIQLTGKEDKEKDYDIVLNWSAYTGWINGVDSYVVQKFDSQGQLIRTFDPTTSTTLDDDTEDLFNQVCIYVVNAIPNDAGLNNSVSNTITIIKEPNLYYPTAFTPNGDNLNEIFKVIGRYVVKLELKIFNRWGELLFTTNDLEVGWDGTFKGTEMPEGTYAFVAKITDLAGRTFDRSGSVLLLKKK